MTSTAPRPARCLSVAGVAASMKIKPATLAQMMWRHPGYPEPDVIIEPGHGSPDRGWLPERLPEWEVWRASMPGRGAGGGRPPRPGVTGGPSC